MRFWFREIAGWFFIALGLFVFYLCWVLLANNHVVEAGPVTLIGIIIFRGGIHLLKVAVAARICLYAQDQIKHQPRPARNNEIVARRFAPHVETAQNS